MKQRIVGRVGRKIAGLPKQKEIRYKGHACRNALAKLSKFIRQQDDPADQVSRGEHDGERRKYPAYPAGVEFHEPERTVLNLSQNDAGDQKPGNDEKYIDADEATGQ